MNVEPNVNKVRQWIPDGDIYQHCHCWQILEMPSKEPCERTDRRKDKRCPRGSHTNKKT